MPRTVCHLNCLGKTEQQSICKTHVTQNKELVPAAPHHIASLLLLFQGRNEHCCPSKSFYAMSFYQELHRDRSDLIISLNKKARSERRQCNYITSMSDFMSVYAGLLHLYSQPSILDKTQSDKVLIY